jgi:hypothetical protein
MSKEFEKIDQLIKEALTEEEVEFYDKLDEQNVFQMLGGLFTGKNKWIMVVMNVAMLLIFIALIYCIICFFSTDITNELIKWAIAGLICINAISLLKQFAWMQMDKNSIIRELKRLELQISNLASKLSSR